MATRILFHPTSEVGAVAENLLRLYTASMSAATVNPAGSFTGKHTAKVPYFARGWKSSCRFIGAGYSVYMTSQCSAPTLLPLTF